jgi:hypothetical protein
MNRCVCRREHQVLSHCIISLHGALHSVLS